MCRAAAEASAESTGGNVASDKKEGQESLLLRMYSDGTFIR